MTSMWMGAVTGLPSIATTPTISSPARIPFSLISSVTTSSLSCLLRCVTECEVMGLGDEGHSDQSWEGVAYWSLVSKEPLKVETFGTHNECPG